MKLKFGLAILILGLLWGCTKNTYEFVGDTSAVVVEQNNKIFIQDQQGKLWDVTYGVENLGFFAESFERGVGIDRFIPIIDPHFLLPGDNNYPSNESPTRVIGLSINGENRAYATDILRGVEIADDAFPTETPGDSLYLAVGW